MKRIIKLTESGIRGIVSESVRRILNEIGDTEKSYNLLGMIDNKNTEESWDDLHLGDRQSHNKKQARARRATSVARELMGRNKDKINKDDAWTAFKLGQEEEGANRDKGWKYKGDVEITQKLKDYLEVSMMGEMGDRSMSEYACRMHDELMRLMGLSHQDIEDRKIFSKILGFAKNLFSLNCDMRVSIRDRKYLKIRDSKSFSTSGKSYNIKKWGEEMDGVVYKTTTGVIQDKTVSWNQGDEGYEYEYDGYQVQHAHLSQAIINKIRSMGLVPAIDVNGTFHENFVEARGILPSMVNVYRRRHCWYDENYEMDNDNYDPFACKF